MKQKCDTCGREVEEVSRIVIRAQYDRSKSVPKYNCPDCYEIKRKEVIEKEKSQK
jgi:hypothetical protein